MYYHQSMIKDLLIDIGAHEFVNRDWNGNSLCPYSNNELMTFASMTYEENHNLKLQFNEFKKNYGSLHENDKSQLKSWLNTEFIAPVWKIQGKTFPRPEFAKNSFFSLCKKNGKLLDIGPCHGMHGLLLYRDHYQFEFEYSCADMLPAYNKLLCMLGINVYYYNANYDQLPNHLYDVITCTEFLEHIDQKAENRLLSEVTQISNIDCKILFTFPVVALPDGKINLNEPMGHIRQPIISDVITQLNNFEVFNHGKFRSSKSDQNYLIGKRI